MLSDEIGVIPTATDPTPRIGGIMTIAQITESTAITEKKAGVITEITGTGVTLTTQTIANTEITEITEAIGIPTHIGNTEVIENTADTESMETIEMKRGRRFTPQAECPLERHIGRTATLAKLLWREHLNSTPSKLVGLSPLCCMV